MAFRHWICLIALALAVAIQWPLWFGRGGVLRMQALEAELSSVRAANDRLRAENDAVAAEIESLENGDGAGAVEERARMRLGMIVRGDEVLFRLVPKGQDKTKLPPLATEENLTKGGRIFVPKRSNLYVPGELAPEKKPSQGKAVKAMPENPE